MTYAIRIPSKLHNLIPHEVTVSSLIRQLLAGAVANPGVIVSAFTTRSQFVTSPDLEIQRYSIYLPKEERLAAEELARQYLMSLNQLIQTLLEDALYRSNLWP
jgi:hypothetical protein